MDQSYLSETIEQKEMGQYEVRPDLLCVRSLFVNFFLWGKPGARSGEWVLIDTGLGMSAKHIFQAVDERFESGSKPKAIILTHGHFDHVGSASHLIDTWQVPVYAHALEMPFLTGQEDYPAPDPQADTGLIARMSPFFPHNAVNLGPSVQPLPEDDSVPGMPGWKWIHTPGHTPGHVSLFRDEDRTLIAADAFVTVKQESAVAVLLQRKEVHSPPKYLTPDWISARESVKRLLKLEPEIAATGHGAPMSGDELIQGLQGLVKDLDKMAGPT